MSNQHFNDITDAFIYYTECQFATLEYLASRKSTSKSELKRQLNITSEMLAQLTFKHIVGDVFVRIINNRLCPSVKEWLTRDPSLKNISLIDWINRR